LDSPIVWKDRPVYLENPLLDKMMGVILELAAQVYVMKDRQAITELFLEEHNIVSRDQLDKWEPTPEQQIEIRKRRDEFMASVFRPISEG
jgi:hypothetical protein